MTGGECTCDTSFETGESCPVHKHELVSVGALVESAPSTDVQAIRASQGAFEKVMDELIALYRKFDKTRRQAMKDKLKSLRERLVELGATIGVSRVSLDSLWQG